MSVCNTGRRSKVSRMGSVMLPEGVDGPEPALRNVYESAVGHDRFLVFT